MSQVWSDEYGSIKISRPVYERYVDLREVTRDRLDQPELVNDQFMQLLLDIHSHYLEEEVP